MRLAILAERGHPAFDVVHPELAVAHVAGRGLDHLIGDFQRLQHRFRIGEQAGVPACALLVIVAADHILFELVELVDAEQPAHVAPGAPRLAAETGGIAGIEDRQLVRLDDLARMERGQRDLPGAGEIEIVGRHEIGLFLVPREMAGGDEGRGAGERRDGHQGEAVGRKPLLRPQHQRLFQHREPPLEAIGARSGDLRDAGKIGPVVLLDQGDMIERREIEIRNRALGPHHRIEALVRPDRRALPRDVRHAKQQRVERRLLLAEIALDPGNLRADRLGLGAERRPLFGRGALEAVGDRVALGAKAVDPRLERAHLSVERQQRVKIERDVLLADRLADGPGILANELKAEHQRGLAGTRQKAS